VIASNQFKPCRSAFNTPNPLFLIIFNIPLRSYFVAVRFYVLNPLFLIIFVCWSSFPLAPTRSPAACREHFRPMILRLPRHARAVGIGPRTMAEMGNFYLPDNGSQG
jgi:hypothetical protein